MALDPHEVITEFLQSHDLDFELKDRNTFMVTLPGEAKLQTHCALVVGDHTLSINAFVIRKPDTHEDVVHKWCMTKNAAIYGIAFAIMNWVISIWWGACRLPLLMRKRLIG